MSGKVKIGIIGYGNLGRGVEAAISRTDDLELVAVFSRRDPKTVEILHPETVQVLHIDEVENFKNTIDVMILCGGSAKDLPEQGPQFAQYFNTIDSFDTHAK